MGVEPGNGWPAPGSSYSPPPENVRQDYFSWVADWIKGLKEVQGQARKEEKK